MQKQFFVIAALLVLVGTGCSSISASSMSPTAPAVSSTASGLKCRDNVCIRAVTVAVTDGRLAVRFALIDPNGQVDALNPPRFANDNLSLELFWIRADGAEEPISQMQPADCFASDRFQEFGEQLVGICGFLVPATTGTASVQVGDQVKVSLKEFGFESLVTVREDTISRTPQPGGAASVTDVFFMLPDGSAVKSLAFPKDIPLVRLIVMVANAPANTPVKFVLTAVDVGDVVPTNSMLGEVEQLANGSESLIFTMRPPASGEWPVGKYKADIYLDGTFDRTLEFSFK